MSEDPPTAHQAGLPSGLQEKLFSIHFELPAGKRAAALERLLAEAPGYEAALRRAYRRLAGAEAAVGGARDLARQALEDLPPVSEPEQIGPYRIVRRLGEGGMGVVYLAEQSEPVRRQVALKVIKLGMDSRRVLARFELERQSLAMMQHEHIARVFDAGTTAAGQPFFVMESVPGVPLTEYCDDHRLDTRARLALFMKVCAGVQHAHQKGIVHRDLKPSNILVMTRDGEAVPKIIDFGLARATDRDAVQITLFTEEGVMIGTPEYMSPEQAEGREVDTRTDVYSLGVILYELLVGELPISAAEVRRAGLSDLQRILREREPVLPSRRVSQERSGDRAARRSTSVDALRKTLRGDLDWIVLQAMEKEPERRYATANELLADIARHLANEPVLAAAPSALYRLRKFVRRNRGRVAAAVALLVALISGTVGTALGLAEAEQNLARYDLLRNVVLLQEAREAIPGLYPERPEKATAMRRWIEGQGQPLIDRLPVLRAAREELLERAGGQALEAGDRFLAGALARLIADIEAFSAPETGDVARVRDSLAWAESVREQTLLRHAGAWEEAIAAIAASDGRRASERYDHLEIAPQIGLVPIGCDPATRLWEFAMPRSGRVPVRNADGVLEFDGDSALVFVLLPGGEDDIGAQPDPAGPNHDPQASAREGPVHRVRFDPFFVSKYEMTQGQWMRLDAGRNPSRYRPGMWFPVHSGERGHVTAAHPVETVSWDEARALLDRHGLDFPTNAQWEYACRGGRDTPWWTGTARETLLGAANLADRSARAGGFGTREAADDWPELNDGWSVHAPVQTMRPNPFGLHHVHGNVWEWCRDQHDRRVAPRSGDGLRESGRLGGAAHRGGGFMDAASAARCCHYSNSETNSRYADLGLRPVRRLER